MKNFVRQSTLFHDMLYVQKNVIVAEISNYAKIADQPLIAKIVMLQVVHGHFIINIGAGHIMNQCVMNVVMVFVRG